MNRGRDEPRFPVDKVSSAAREIERVLDGFEAGPEDLSLTQGAAGGDLLFAEACLARGVRLQLLVPFLEPEFVERSVLSSVDGPTWGERWLALPRTPDSHRYMPEELGPTSADDDEFERCNRWLLFTALAYGAEKLRFICLWDGGEGEGRGGTRHMIDEVRKRKGKVEWIDSRKL